MSKPVKKLIREELTRRFDGLTSLAVVGFTGLDAVSTNNIRGRLREKDIRMSVVKNSLARQAFAALGMDGAKDLLDGPCAIAYGSDSVVTVVRELLDIHEESPALTVKAAILEGEIFGEDQIEALSKYPNRDEAISQALGSVLSGGGNLVGALIGPGGKLASILKTIEDSHDAEPEEQAPAPADEPAAEAEPAENAEPAADAEPAVETE